MVGLGLLPRLPPPEEVGAGVFFGSSESLLPGGGGGLFPVGVGAWLRFAIGVFLGGAVAVAVPFAAGRELEPEGMSGSGPNIG